MYCSDQQIHLIRSFSLFNAKTGYGRFDTVKSLDKAVSYCQFCCKDASSNRLGRNEV